VHIDTVLMKVASRCNFNCSYCYVYNMGDENWRAQPKRLSAEVQQLVAAELGSLMREQGHPFSVVLHGGEPLLLGPTRIELLIRALRAELGSACGISIQTNGVLLSEAILGICAQYDVTISVSLDGPAEIHDRCRVDLGQRPTHEKVMAGITLLKAHPQADRLFSGVLAVVDPTSDPASIYKYFKGLAVPNVDFLYRDGNHTTLPHGKASVQSVEYGRWMSSVLDCYVADPAPFRIRMLDDMMKLMLGGYGVKEGVGLTDYGILVIDTDGSIKKNDTLKSSPPGDKFNEAWSVASHSLTSIAASPAFEAYHYAQRPTSATCRTCPHLTVCGGGMLTHRYKDGYNFDNPTVFCDDQKLLVARMEYHLARFRRQCAA